MTNRLTLEEREELRRDCESVHDHLVAGVIKLTTQQILDLLNALDEADKRIAELEEDLNEQSNSVLRLRASLNSRQPEIEP